MATASKTTIGFELKCPHCGADGCITLDVNDLQSELRCSDCDESFPAKEARGLVADQVRRWDALLAWIETAGPFLVG